MKILLLIFLFISCGSPMLNAKRCFTKEEAKNACIVDEITKTGVAYEIADIICSPYYQADMCYQLN